MVIIFHGGMYSLHSPSPQYMPVSSPHQTDLFGSRSLLSKRLKHFREHPGGGGGTLC